MIVRGRITEAVDGRSPPISLMQPAQAGREHEPAEQPEHGGEQADHPRLEHDRAQHLAAAGAERAQQAELARALRDGDRERVVDDERADEQRDRAEDEQRRAHEAEVLLEVGGLLGGVLLAGADLDRAPASAALTAARSRAGVTPSRAAIAIVSTLPRWPASACAVGSVTIAAG